MLCILFAILFFSQSLFATLITVVPPASGALAKAWPHISRQLENHGITAISSDLSEITPLSDPKELFHCSKYVLFINLPTWIENWQEKLKLIPKKKLVLVVTKSPVQAAELFSPKLLNRFSKVLTWDDTAVDNIHYFKINQVALQPMIEPPVPFSKKKLLTLLASNKFSNHPLELYSSQRSLIQFFEQKTGYDFEFYGKGWQDFAFHSYRGTVFDKIETLKNYRFCICYENIKHVQGFVSKKIFDCFKAGVVPVYFGASNIGDYIPSGCYISREKFATIDALYAHLKRIKEQEYNEYIEHIQAFLQSEQAARFSENFFIQTLVFNLLR